MSSDNDSYSTTPSSSSSPIIQLGFSTPLLPSSSSLFHTSPHWSQWDGGKIGGVPIWLNPRDIPHKTPLLCTHCHIPLRFIVQLYCPGDDDDAFHRTLYVFACPSGSGHCKGGGGCEEGGVVVLRCQLARRNEFYPFEGGRKRDEDDEVEEEMGGYDVAKRRREASQRWKVSLCAVCGQRSKGTCPIQKQPFCGKKCQQEHMTHIHKKRNNNNNNNSNTNNEKTNSIDNARDTTNPITAPPILPSLFSESELIVEEEPPPRRQSPSLEQQYDKNKDIYGDDEADLTQAALNDATGSKSTTSLDRLTMVFQSRLRDREEDVQNQCLRYCRWPELETMRGVDVVTEGGDIDDDDEEEEEVLGIPLWISEVGRPPVHQQQSSTDRIPPPCEYCGAERKFECQIMPQMLHYLRGGVDDGLTTPSQKETETGDAMAQRLGSLALSQNSSSSNKNNGTTNDQRRDDLDWGVIVVYTCTKSCCGSGVGDVGGDMGAYRLEYAWRQPPLE